jgi:hypothetical protein
VYTEDGTEDGEGKKKKERGRKEEEGKKRSERWLLKYL